MSLSILYQDDYLVAINKPSGLLVHRSAIDKRENSFAVQTLRNQLGQQVSPIHRLDKPTSGVLLFALNKETAATLSANWQDVKKNYIAISRGNVSSQNINHPITTNPDKGDTFTEPKVQEAQTDIRNSGIMKLPIGFGKSAASHPSTNFSLVYATPKTGRKHQIRKHLKHLSHPIVGDTCYGRGEINRHFRDTLAINRLMLHCLSMQFIHPITQRPMNIYAPLDATWYRYLIYQNLVNNLRS